MTFPVLTFVVVTCYAVAGLGLSAAYADDSDPLPVLTFAASVATLAYIGVMR